MEVVIDIDNFKYSDNESVCRWLDNLYSAVDRSKWEYEYDNDIERIEWLEAQLNNKKEQWKDAHFNKMCKRFNIVDSPYDEGAYYPITAAWWLFFKLYDTKIVLCGDYIKLYSYDINSREEAYTHDTKTGKVNKYYDHNSWNKKDRFIDWALTNEKFFKTWITLTNRDIDDIDEVRRVFRNFAKEMKRKAAKKNKEFYYMMAIEKGTEGAEKIHIHMLTSLDIDDDSEMFVKSDNKDKKWEHEYRFLSWKHGSAVAYPIRTSIDHLFISIYNSKDIDLRQFYKRRNTSKSRNLIKPKVFCYNSRVDQRKIDIVLKGAEEIFNKQYKDYFSRDTATTLYKRCENAEQELGWVVGFDPDDPFG